MDFIDLLNLVGDDPIFESSMLLAGAVDPKSIRIQLTRWVNNGRIQQIRRGLYSIAPPYRKTVPHPFLVANQLKRASYVSLHSALSYYGLIPEAVMVTTSVTTRRPERLVTPLGNFEFRHLKTQLLFGYQMLDFGGQTALVATPEKALLDLVYLTPAGESPAYLQELRLQNADQLNIEQLRKTANRFGSPKVDKAMSGLLKIIQAETVAYEGL